MGRWRFDLAHKGSSSSSKASLPRPIGYESHYVPDESSLASTTVSSAQEKSQREQEAYKLAMSPGGGLLSTAFMLWMSGSTLQIFSIMMISMAFINPIRAIGGIESTFSKFETGQANVNLRFPKLIFLGFQLLSLGLALYKASTLGLLPLTSADWLSYIPDRVYAEQSLIPLM